MTLDEMLELFEKHEETVQDGFEAVWVKLSKRRDLHVFMLLDKLVPGDGWMVTSATHDQIWLDIDMNKLAAVITEPEIVELVRCGVIISEDSLSMFI